MFSPAPCSLTWCSAAAGIAVLHFHGLSRWTLQSGFPQEASLLCFIWMEIKHMRSFFVGWLVFLLVFVFFSAQLGFSASSHHLWDVLFHPNKRVDPQSVELIPQGSSPTFQPTCPHPDTARPWACAAGFDMQLLCLLLPPLVSLYLFYLKFRFYSVFPAPGLPGAVP